MRFSLILPSPDTSSAGAVARVAAPRPPLRGSPPPPHRPEREGAARLVSLSRASHCLPDPKSSSPRPSLSATASSGADAHSHRRTRGERPARRPRRPDTPCPESRRLRAGHRPCRAHREARPPSIDRPPLGQAGRSDRAPPVTAPECRRAMVESGVRMS